MIDHPLQEIVMASLFARRVTVPLDDYRLIYPCSFLASLSMVCLAIVPREPVGWYIKCKDHGNGGLMYANICVRNWFSYPSLLSR